MTLSIYQHWLLLLPMCALAFAVWVIAENKDAKL